MHYSLGKSRHPWVLWEVFESIHYSSILEEMRGLILWDRSSVFLTPVVTAELEVIPQHGVKGFKYAIQNLPLLSQLEVLAIRGIIAEGCYFRWTYEFGISSTHNTYDEYHARSLCDPFSQHLVGSVCFVSRCYLRAWCNIVHASQSNVGMILCGRDQLLRNGGMHARTHILNNCGRFGYRGKLQTVLIRRQILPEGKRNEESQRRMWAGWNDACISLEPFFAISESWQWGEPGWVVCAKKWSHQAVSMHPHIEWHQCMRTS